MKELNLSFPYLRVIGAKFNKKFQKLLNQAVYAERRKQLCWKYTYPSLLGKIQQNAKHVSNAQYWKHQMQCILVCALLYPVHTI